MAEDLGSITGKRPRMNGPGAPGLPSALRAARDAFDLDPVAGVPVAGVEDARLPMNRHERPTPC